MFQRLKVFCLVTALCALAPGIAVAGPLAGSCLVDKMPSATLLYPYFEVDLDDPNGRSTLISVNNSSAEPTLAKVVVWTDCHLPILSFDVYLGANDVSTINLRNVLVGGNLVSTSPDADGQQAFPSCTSPLTNPTLDAAAVADLQAKLTGQPSPVDGQCYGSERDANRIAVGFLTVDVLNDCSDTIRLPDDPGYFADGGLGLASNRNVLWGDYYMIDPSQDFAQGFEAVGTVADADRFDDVNIRSFYQVTEDQQDNRVPLSSKLRTRFLNGGAFDGSTQFIVWAQRAPELLPFSCADAAGSCPMAADLRLDMDFFDESGELTVARRIIPTAFVSKFDIQDLDPGTDFGVLFLDSKGLRSPVGPAGLLEQRQAWMLQTSSATNRFSVGMSASRMDDLCKVSAQGE